MESDLGKLFIGGISWDTTEDRLREYFNMFGEIVEAVILKDRATGRARGFGFVVFADSVVAERVVTEKHLIDGRMAEAKKAVPRDDQHILSKSNSSLQGSPGPGRTKKIFVGGLASSITDADFKKYFEQFGVITDVVVMYDHNPQRPRGFVFITFDSEDAVDRVLYKTFHELNGKMVEVKRAVPKELSPAPNMRSSPVGGYSYGLNRVNSFLNGYSQGYNPSSIASYGMRMDGRLEPFTGGRNVLPSLISDYGIRMNSEPGMSTSYGGNSNFNSTFGFGRTLSPYYTGNSSRFVSPVGYGAGSVNPGSSFNSASRSLWGDDGLNYNTNPSSSNSYMTSGSGSLRDFSNSSLKWGGSSSPLVVHGVGSNSGFNTGNMSFGNGDNNLGLVGGSSGRISSGIVSGNTSFTAASNGYDANYIDSYGRSSIYGDRTWQSASSGFDDSRPFGYAFSGTASDYMGGYNVPSRQMNRGIQIVCCILIKRKLDAFFSNKNRLLLFKLNRTDLLPPHLLPG